MNEDNNEEIKKQVGKILAAGKQIRYEWDAGGDQTICNLVEEDDKHVDENLRGILYRHLVDELQLPNAGEHYHKGSGEIFMTAENAVAVRFSGFENNYYIDKSIPTACDYFDCRIEDRGNLRRYLHRATVMVHLVCDWKTGWELEVHADIEEGDSPAISKEAEEYYTAILRPYLEPYAARFGMREDGYLGGTVRIYFKVTDSDEVGLELDPEYQMVEEHENKEVILIP